MSFLKRLWNEEDGVMLSTEAVLATGLVVWGVCAGLENLRDAVNKELTDLGNQVGSINNSFTITGVSSTNGSYVSGSSFNDSNQKFYTIQER